MSTHQDQNESVQPREANLCLNNCGFFANPAHMGYCSKCYRDMCDREQRQAKEDSGAETTGSKLKASIPDSVVVESPSRPRVSLIQPVGPVVAVAPAAALSTGTSTCPPVQCGGRSVASTTSLPPRPNSKKKCGACSKKVGLTGFNCKCGGVFCGLHRYAEAHQCGFDHKSSERQKLAEDNPLVQASKLDRL